jgi:hypothetical protein
VVLEGNLGAESHAAGVLLFLVFLRHARRRFLLRIHDPTYLSWPVLGFLLGDAQMQT